MVEDTSGEAMKVVSVLNSTLESVDAAEALVLRVAEEMGFDEDVRYQIGMAVRESMVNAVVHGNCYNDHKKVRLGITKGSDRLTITVADEGRGFSVKKIPDPLAQENLLSQSGRGIFLIRAFMDEFDVNPVEPVGSEMKLVKYLNQNK
jgi:serine/threonine-protein kinase RsbW